MRCVGMYLQKKEPSTIPTVYWPHDLSYISAASSTMFLKNAIFCCTKFCLDLRHQKKSDSRHLYLQRHTHPAFIGVGVSGLYRSRWNSRNDRKYRAISHPQFCRNDLRNPQTCCGPFRNHYYWWARRWQDCLIITPKAFGKGRRKCM